MNTIPLKKLYGTDSTNDTAPAWGSGLFVDGTTDPAATAGVLPLVVGQRYLRLRPYGTGADNSTFNMYVFLICRTPNINTATAAYEIAYKNLFAVTLSAATGSATGFLGSTNYRFADTIVYTAGGQNYEIDTNGSDFPAEVRIDTLYADYAYIFFDRTGATACNALYALYSDAPIVISR